MYNSGMKVLELGEFGLIRLLAAGVSHPDSNLLVGIGDDAAVWSSWPQATVATTDTLFQGVHFDLQFITWYELGWKALAVNISDIAAMGAVPRYAVVSLGLPGDAEVEAVQELYRGMAGVGGLFQTTVVGGDVVRSPGGAMVAVTVFGHAIDGDESKGRGRAKDRVPILKRSAARAGDLVAVTGSLGASAAGLRMLRMGAPLDPTAEAALRLAHLKPLPRVREGQALVRAGVKAAIDISDGTIGDLVKVCEASGVGARVRVDRLPVRAEVRNSFPEESYDEFALHGGEDYELLFTAPAKVVDEARGRVKTETGTEITVIGEITRENPGVVVVIDRDGAERPVKAGGYDHFAAATQP